MEETDYERKEQKKGIEKLQKAEERNSDRKRFYKKRGRRE